MGDEAGFPVFSQLEQPRHPIIRARRRSRRVGHVLRTRVRSAGVNASLRRVHTVETARIFQTRILQRIHHYRVDS